MKKNKFKFALFGSGYSLVYFAKKLKEMDLADPFIFTHPEVDYKQDNKNFKGKIFFSNIFKYSKENKLSHFQFKDFNSSQVLKILKKNKINFGFSYASRTIFSERIIKYFKKNLFNLHPSFLPENRGGGTYSWTILNDYKYIGATIHLVNKRIDEGNIIFQKKTKINLHKKKVYLERLMLEFNGLSEKLIDKFLFNISINKTLKYKKQKENNSTYLPRLYTTLNGAIDWNLDIDNIEKFIRAFSNPYPGSFTFIKNKKVIIKSIKIVDRNSKFHPLCYGRVYSINNEDGSIKVICNGGIIKIKELYVSNKKYNASKIVNKLTIFHSPLDVILDAKFKILST